MICDNCIHQDACISAYNSLGYFIDKTKAIDYGLINCEQFADKSKFQEVKYSTYDFTEAPSYLTIACRRCRNCGDITAVGVFCMWCGAKMDGE